MNREPKHFHLPSVGKLCRRCPLGLVVWCTRHIEVDALTSVGVRTVKLSFRHRKQPPVDFLLLYRDDFPGPSRTMALQTFSAARAADVPNAPSYIYGSVTRCVSTNEGITEQVRLRPGAVASQKNQSLSKISDICPSRIRQASWTNTSRNNYPPNLDDSTSVAKRRTIGVQWRGRSRNR
jgi:hypothetical protein